MEKKKRVLLVEDDENDVFFMRRALEKTKLGLSLEVVMDGQEALDYLAGTGTFVERTRFPLPDILFIDLKLPYVNGFDVLSWVRGQPAFREMPVIILTSSPEDRDRSQAEQLGVRAYCVKPPTREMLLEILAPFVDTLDGAPSTR